MKFSVPSPPKLPEEKVGAPDQGISSGSAPAPFPKSISVKEVFKKHRFIWSLALCLLISGTILLIFSVLSPLKTNDQNVTDGPVITIGTSTSTTEKDAPIGTTETMTSSEAETTLTWSETQSSLETEAWTERTSSDRPEWETSAEPIMTTTISDSETGTFSKEVELETTTVGCTELPDPEELLLSLSSANYSSLTEECCCIALPCKSKDIWPKYTLTIELPIMVHVKLESEILCPRSAYYSYCKQMAHLALLNDYFRKELEEYLSQRGPWCWSERPTYPPGECHSESIADKKC